MFDKLINFGSKPSIDFLIKLGISVTLVCFISPYSWEISPEYTVRFGSLMVCAIAATFGWRIGGLSTLVYLIAGASGLPVFDGHSGGMNYFISDKGFHPSTGFLFGYLMAALAVGYAAEKVKYTESLKLIGLFFLGHVIILGLGYFHMHRIPDFPLDLLNRLKSIVPSFLVKMGVFTVILSIFGRNLSERKISTPVDI